MNDEQRKVLRQARRASKREAVRQFFGGMVCVLWRHKPRHKMNVTYCDRCGVDL